MELWEEEVGIWDGREKKSLPLLPGKRATPEAVFSFIRLKSGKGEAEKKGGKKAGWQERTEKTGEDGNCRGV